MRRRGSGRWLALGVVVALLSVASQVRAQGATPPPTLSIAAASVTEKNTGTTAMAFVVTASAAVKSATSVHFATTDGTAVAPGDYTAKSGTATIPVGARTTTITVSVNGDKLYEKNETFTVTLSNPVNATLGTKSAVGTITNDDAAPTVSVGAASVTEGNSGTKSMPFTASVSAVSGLPTTVSFHTTDGTAKAPGDYQAKTGSVTIPAGSTSAVITVLVVGDTVPESTETMKVTLSAPVNATLGTATGTGTIVDDDPETVSVAPSSLAEGSTGTAPMTFTVSLPAPHASAVSVHYATSNGTAVAPGDYTAKGGTVTIATGATSATFTVLVVGDTIDEANETFTVTLSNPTGAVLGTATATGTIVDDDDSAPVVSVAPVSVAEGNSGTVAARFTITSSAVSGLPVTVSFASSDGTAHAPGDYTAATGTVTIPAGSTSVVVSVSVLGDTLYETNETFSLTLSGPVNATLGTAIAKGTILNDDPVPVVTVSGASQPEGDTGTTLMPFVVSIPAPSGLAVAATYATSDGSAKAPDDYASTTGIVIVPAGSTSTTVTVAIAGDVLDEGNETFTLTLSAPINATLGAATATGTIVDDDLPPAISIADTSVPDGEAGTTTPAVFTVTLGAVSGLDATVGYTTADGTATQPDNYTATSGILTIAAGSTTGTISVPVIGGMAHAGDRTFSVTLSDPTNATITDAIATGTIVDEHRLGIATGASFWGLTSAAQETQLADLEAMGAQWIRTTLFWRSVQPDGPDSYDWSEADSIVAAAARHHIAIIWLVIGAPRWAVPGSQPGDLSDYSPDPSLYAAFVAAAAARYDPQGVTAYELGNSENDADATNTPSASFYTSLLCDSYSAIKAVAPDATVLTGGLGGTTEKNGDISGAHFVAQLYAAGAKGCFDAISFHPYTYPQFAPDDGTAGWSAMLTVRQTMVDNGDADLKIWATEYGAPTNGPNANHVSEDAQAQMLDTAYRLFAGYSWSGPMCWFRYDDKGTDPSDQSNFFGLIRFDGSRKPAYSVFVADATAAIP